jgi:hypothetical protein
MPRIRSYPSLEALLLREIGSPPQESSVCGYSHANVLNGCNVSKTTVSVSRIDSFGWLYVRVVGGGGGGGGEVGMIAHAARTLDILCATCGVCTVCVRNAC